jgi:hypothetical protein
MLFLVVFRANHVINPDWYRIIRNYLLGFVAQLDELDMIQDDRTNNFYLVLHSINPVNFLRYRCPYF